MIMEVEVDEGIVIDWHLEYSFCIMKRKEYLNWIFMQHVSGTCFLSESIF